MPDTPDSRLDLRSLLDAVENAAPAATVDVIAAELARVVDARQVSFLIVDYPARVFVRLTGSEDSPAGQHGRGGSAEQVPIVDTGHGRTLHDQRVQVLVEADGVRVLAPVTDRGEAIGVLDMVMNDPPDDATLTYLASAAHALA
ncbi:MAG: hypothetical protein ACRDYZ_15605 [Acidimicrobiales bacterium]